MRDPFEELKEDIKERLFRLDGTAETEKKYELLVSILELLKLMTKQKQPRLPLEVEVEGKQKVIKTREELITFIRGLQNWLLKAIGLLDEEELTPILLRAKIIILQLVYMLGFYEAEELHEVDYAQNKINSRETGTPPSL